MSNTANNPTKVITGPNTRWSYANVWTPKAINGGEPKYSINSSMVSTPANALKFVLIIPCFTI